LGGSALASRFWAFWYPSNCMSVSPEQIESEICSRLTGVAAKASWGETSLFYNPDQKLPNGVYFCTIKEHDGDNDRSSRLNRSGVFRLSIGLNPRTYIGLFGPKPSRPAKGGIISTGHQFDKLDELMPHPIYGWMAWAQVLCPSRSTWETLVPLIDESYAKAVSKFEKRLAQSDFSMRTK